jgi:hypothetical protein
MCGKRAKRQGAKYKNKIITEIGKRTLGGYNEYHKGTNNK